MAFEKRFNLYILCLGILILALITGVAACGGSKTSSPTSTTQPATTSPLGIISLAKDIQPVFTSKCVVCHQGTPASGGLSQQSALQRVLPGQPDKSYLVAKLQGAQVQAGGSGGQMPYGTLPLAQSQIDLIKLWITQGALNN
jgi:uncharacterized membrane protein